MHFQFSVLVFWKSNAFYTISRGNNNLEKNYNIIEHIFTFISEKTVIHNNKTITLLKTISGKYTKS